MTVDWHWTCFVRNWKIISWWTKGDVDGPSSWRGCCEDEALCTPCLGAHFRAERFRRWVADGHRGAFS